MGKFETTTKGVVLIGISYAMELCSKCLNFARSDDSVERFCGSIAAVNLSINPFATS